MSKMNNDSEIILTRQGFDALEKELNEILTVKRPEVVDRIRQARELGDLSENFDYDDAKHSQAILESRLQEIRAILSHAVVAEPKNEDGSICIGSKVVVKDTEDDYEDEYLIVGSAESNALEGKISYESPMGAALMGRKQGETVEIETPGGTATYEIISVE